MRDFKSQGLALRELRKENKLTILEVTNKLNHCPMWLSDIETGKKNIYFKDAKELCKLYGCSLNDFSKLIDKYEPKEN